MNRVRMFGAALLGSLMVCSTLAADTLESVEKQIVDANDKVKSMTGKLTSKGEMSMGGTSMTNLAEGTFEYVRQGDKMRYRIDMKNSMSQGEMKMDSTALLVCDGETVLVIQDQGGMKQGMKMKPDGSKMQLSAKQIFEEMRKEYDLKLLPDETIDGKPAYTIEATPKTANPMGMTKMVMNFAKDTGVFLKQVGFDKDGKAIQTTTFTDLKINPDIDPKRFDLVVPEGVNVVDMTAGPPGQPPAEAAPAKP